MLIFIINIFHILLRHTQLAETGLLRNHMVKRRKILFSSP